MESLWEKLVLPEEEGPAIMTNFTFSLPAISFAISPIIRSCFASCTRIRSLTEPLQICSFRSPTVSIPAVLPQPFALSMVSNSFLLSVKGSSVVGLDSEGSTSLNPSS